MAESQTGIAFVGTGGVAHMHAHAVGQIRQARLIGGYSRKQENLEKFASAFGIRPYRDLHELLDDPTVEVVSVLTPVASHAELAAACLEAGKHVLVEKPVAHTAGEIRALQKAAENASRLCVPVHNYIYSPAIQRAKRLIDQGKLGKLSSLWMLYNQKHPADMANGRPDLLLRELHVHHAYVTLFLGGRPLRIAAMASNIHFEDKASNDQAMILCELPGGAAAHLWGSFAVDDPTSSPWTVYYKVLGTKGGMTHSWSDSSFGAAPLPGWDLGGYRDSFLETYEHFVARCLGKGEPPLSNLDDAADALRILEASEESIARRIFVEVNYS